MIDVSLDSVFILGPATIALGDGTSVAGRIAMHRGRITDIYPADGPFDLALPAGTIVAPGLIDIHTNGAGEFLFNRDQGNAVPVAAAEYARSGATGFVASVMTAPWESMLHAASDIAESAHELQENGTRGARCLGIHFEGPFLNPKYRRVHRPEWIVHASAERAHEMVDACKGTLLMVTMAPEIDGAPDAARVFLENGVTCSAGHTSARYREGLLAIGSGYRSLTHAFNGMGALDHRDPSILLAFIQDSRTIVQLICDGQHVAPPMVELLHRLIGERIALTTDCMPPAGPGYHIEGGVMRAEDGTIAGSALLIDQAVRNFMEYTGLPFERAVVGATSAPAKVIGHERELGRIAPGMRADLSIWNAEHQVIGTIVGGEFAYDLLTPGATLV